MASRPLTVIDDPAQFVPVVDETVCTVTKPLVVPPGTWSRQLERSPARLAAPYVISRLA
jgi:hypothetical protein